MIVKGILFILGIIDIAFDTYEFVAKRVVKLKGFNISTGKSFASSRTYSLSN